MSNKGLDRDRPFGDPEIAVVLVLASRRALESEKVKTLQSGLGAGKR